MMKSLSSIGLALSVIFTCLLLALVFEIYYLLWWKRRFIRRKFTIDEEDHHTKLSYMLCSKNQATSAAVNISTNTLANPTPSLLHDQQEHNKPFEGQNGNFTSGPPQRFLSTIKEETMDDIVESISEDGNIIITRESSKSSRKSLSDLMKNNISIDLCQSNNNNCESLNGYNPFNECSSDTEFSKVFKSSLSSPPPKFKFLRNAEEKLARKTMLMIEQVKRREGNEEGVNGSFTTIIVAKNKEKCEELNHNYHSSLYHSTSCTSSSSSTR